MLHSVIRTGNRPSQNLGGNVLARRADGFILWMALPFLCNVESACLLLSLLKARRSRFRRMASGPQFPSAIVLRSMARPLYLTALSINASMSGGRFWRAGAT